MKERIQYHNIVVSLPPFEMHSRYSMTTTQGAVHNKRKMLISHFNSNFFTNIVRKKRESKHPLVHLPLMWWTIVASLASSMLKLQSNLLRKTKMRDKVNTIRLINTILELNHIYLQDASSCTTFITTTNTPSHKHLSKPTFP